MPLCVFSAPRWVDYHGREKFYNKNYTQQVVSKIEDVGMLFFWKNLLVNPPKTSFRVVPKFSLFYSILLNLSYGSMHIF